MGGWGWSTLTRGVGVVGGVGGLLLSASGSVGQNGFTPVTPSQQVECEQVDEVIRRIPKGNGDGVVTKDETGPEGWHFDRFGRSFVTFMHTWNGKDRYVVVAGRSNVGTNAGVINDYPLILDLPQHALFGRLAFRYQNVLVVDPTRETTLFAPSGTGTGQVQITLHEVDMPNIFVGCATHPPHEILAVRAPEDNHSVLRDYFKAYAETDDEWNVTRFEWTGISTFKSLNLRGK